MSDELTEVWRVMYYGAIAGVRLRCSSYFPSLEEAIAFKHEHTDLEVFSVYRIELDGTPYEDVED